MPPKVLVVGSGGREHALIKQLAASPQTPTLYAAPGNPGTAGLARNLPLGPADTEQLVAFCQEEGIDLVLVGPEDPLIAGMADQMRAAGIAVFGPGADGARLEGDKEFAKEIMAAARVPTAPYRVFSDRQEAGHYLETVSYPVVVKACGAAQGKGVAVCPDRAAAAAHLDLCLTERKFGEAGARLIIEECLAGPELSLLAVTDGEAYAVLAPSRDHKRIGEQDTGPNTGGMGAFAPVLLEPELSQRCEAEVIGPTLAELRNRGISYRGVLYAGLMLTSEGPQVLEFNCRFGDPETQVVLPLMSGDFLALVTAAAQGRLGDHLAQLDRSQTTASWAWPGAALTDWRRHCVVVVGASAGYPGSYAKGERLGLPADESESAGLRHAGTGQGDESRVPAGGRVLGAVGRGDSLAQARDRAYGLMDRVSCDTLYYRRDSAVSAGSAEG
jgi:phosphoribosylamine--glycine ligase